MKFATKSTESFDDKSQTNANLLAAVTAEALAFFKYMVFASKARKEGLEQIAGFFEETAMNELEHGKLWMKALDVIGSTEENLQTAIDNEKNETENVYKSFEQTAREEGLNELADQFKEIGEVEGNHMIRYQKLLKLIQGNEVFKSGDTIMWKCRNCGYIHRGTEAPEECPACKHPKAYFERFVESY